MLLMTGKVYHQMDAKNRIRIPAKFKNAFPKDERLFFVPYNLGRITIMPESVLQRKMEVFGNVDPGDPEKMDAISAFYSSIEEVTEDTQGRTQLPKSVRDYANLEKDVVTNGCGDCIEIWNQKSFDADIASKTKNGVNSALFSKAKSNQ